MWEKLQILWKNVGFIEKRAAKWRNRRQFILWRVIFRNEIPNRVRNDDITTFGMTLWQYSGWRIFFWFWNITCYASGWGWWCDNIWIFTYKLHKEKYDFNLAIKQTICCRGNMKNWWNSINLYSQFSCDCFCIISHNIKKRTYFIK